MSFSFRSHTYHNPVLAQDFPDPFILKYGNHYWAYGTGFAPDGHCFRIFRSADLVEWEECAGALAPLPEGYPCYWAPETSYYNGLFYLYYSVGDEATMQIRVATALHPEGPFVDSGHRLTPEPFAIDPHIAEDDSGNRYLFYATDFLHHSHIGTGTVRARLQDPFTLAEASVPVTRARYDWQVYHPNRPEKGGVRWHTVEGPFVLNHKGRYYQMFSGGNWQNPTYGVSYAISPTLASPVEWEQVADGRRVLPLLRSFPERGIIGPGHNSVVRGPDNRQWYCVYHRWAADGSGRQMAIDPLEWAGGTLVLDGPSSTPRPAPLSPTVAGFDAHAWQVEGGDWQSYHESLTQRATQESAKAIYTVPSASFVLEFLLRAGPGDPNGRVSISLMNPTGEEVAFRLEPESGQLHVTRTATGTIEILELPSPTNPAAVHQVRLEVNHQHVQFTLNSPATRWTGWLDAPLQAIGFYTFNTAALFRDFALTTGWEDVWQADASLGTLGWKRVAPSDDAALPVWSIKNGTLNTPVSDDIATITKGGLAATYEAVITLKILESTMNGYVAIAPLWHPTWQGAQLRIGRGSDGWQVLWGSAASPKPLAMPADFDPTTFQVFRFRKERDWLMVDLDGTRLIETAIPPLPSGIALSATRTAVVVDMVRLTAIPAEPPPVTPFDS